MAMFLLASLSIYFKAQHLLLQLHKSSPPPPPPHNNNPHTNIREVATARRPRRPASDRNGQHGILATRPVRSCRRRRRRDRRGLLVRTEAGEVAPPQVGDEHDVTASPAVRRPAAARHVLLPPEVDRAVPAAAGNGGQLRGRGTCALRAGAASSGRLSAATTEMKRRSPLVRNATLPSRIAKIVSSLPMPVPGPGRKRVPR